MSNELLQRVKDEYAKEQSYQNSIGYHKFKDWDEFFDKIYTDGKPGKIEEHIEEIAERYSAALQSENDRLKVDMQSVIDKHVVIEKAFEQMKADVFEFRETFVGIKDKIKNHERLNNFDKRILCEPINYMLLKTAPIRKKTGQKEYI
jgi:hypothetical protein